MITFFTDSFSQFSVVSDSRSVDITFPIYDEETGASTGTVTITYTPAEIGKELRKSEYGWTIHGKRYTTFEEELFDVEGACKPSPPTRRSIPAAVARPHRARFALHGRDGGRLVL